MRILEKIEVIQGDSTPTIKLGVAGVKSLDGYTCDMNVADQSGVEVVAKREVIEKIAEQAKESFALSLKASETDSLTPEFLYIWTIEITNDLVFYKEEIRIGVVIKKRL